MRCPNCQSNMVGKEGLYKYTESGLDNIFLSGIIKYKCSCGEKAVSIPAIMELHKVIGIILIKKETPLSGKEIKFLRKNIGMSSKVFAEVIGVDKSTLSRWEHDNQIVSKPTDRLIRLVYINIRSIPKNEIQNLIKDKFREIKQDKKSSRLTIPIQDWNKGEMCPAY